MRRVKGILSMLILVSLICPMPLSSAKVDERKIWMRTTYGGYRSSVYHIMIDTELDWHYSVDTFNESYCADAYTHILFNHFYWAKIDSPPDTEDWRAINYIITWFHKAGNYTGEGSNLVYENNLMTPEESNAIGQAIWYFTNDRDPDEEVERAWEIIDEAKGKDVIRGSDSIWSDIADVDFVGYTWFTVKARVSKWNGEGRPGVKLLITVRGGPNQATSSSWPYVDEIEGWTDENGEFEVTVHSPTLPGNTTVDVVSIGRWVRRLNLTDLGRNDEYQTLITLFNSTYANHNGGIIALGTKYGFETIFHIPEFPFGTILPVMSGIFAVLVLYRKKR